MIKLACCNVDDLNLPEVYRLLPEERKNKVDNFRFQKDKKLSAGAYLLLDKLLKEENITRPVFKTFQYDKPYIANHENIHFNLSHSGTFVACAVSDRQIGADIEYNDPQIDLDIAKNYFHDSEYVNIMNAEIPSDEFFRYWVLKESYMKYTGLGFQLDLNSFEIMIINDEISLKDDTDNLNFSLFDIDNYKMAVCSHYPVDNYSEYSVNDLY